MYVCLKQNSMYSIILHKVFHFSKRTCLFPCRARWETLAPSSWWPSFSGPNFRFGQTEKPVSSRSKKPNSGSVFRESNSGIVADYPFFSLKQNCLSFVLKKFETISKFHLFALEWDKIRQITLLPRCSKFIIEQLKLKTFVD